MERYLGLDVHAQSCTLAVISEAGKRLKDLVIETNGQALIEKGFPVNEDRTTRDHGTGWPTRMTRTPIRRPTPWRTTCPARSRP